jgi:hypothetical protein
MRSTNTREMKRAETVLRLHGIPDEKEALRQGPRDPTSIEAIVRDVQAASAFADNLNQP